MKRKEIRKEKKKEKSTKNEKVLTDYQKEKLSNQDSVCFIKPKS